MKTKRQYLRWMMAALLTSTAMVVLCNVNTGATKHRLPAVLPAKEQEKIKAKLMACAFVKKHLAADALPENIYRLKSTACNTYSVEGILKRNDSPVYWHLIFRFNGSDWNNINNWAEIDFRLNYPQTGD